MDKKMREQLEALLGNPNGRNAIRAVADDMANAVNEKRERINKSRAIMLRAEKAQALKEKQGRINPAAQ
jgi:Spy/CpxP family protein refolding chaperone